MEFSLQKKRDGWWIIDGPDSYGPYRTKQEAEEDLRGLKRFYTTHRHPRKRRLTRPRP